MRVRVLVTCFILVATGTTLFAGKSNPVKQKMAEIAVPSENGATLPQKNPSTFIAPSVPPSPSAVGTYTGISGYFDYQLNAGSAQYIRLDKTDATGNKIHAIFMTALDSLAPTGPTRRTAYVYSSNGGQTWTSFSSLAVPNRRSGYPAMDMLQGSTQGVIIANHNDPGTGLSTVVFVDSPPGTGAFSELNTPAALGGDEPIWPGVAGTADGSIVLSASRSAAGTGHYSRTTDFASWTPWATTVPSASAGLPVKANGTGRVAIALNRSFVTPDDGIYILESTNNGSTWPGSATNIAPDPRVVGRDTFAHTLGVDMVYNGTALYAAFAETNIGVNAPTDSAQISFWSQATGVKVAASKVNTPNITPFENLPTLNCVTLDMPSIGMSGTTIVIAYQGMINKDTASNGYNNNDIFLVQSNNGGATWSAPRNITNTRGLDERFVSVAPWNEPGKVNLVWQEDPQAGGNIIGDPGATVNRTRQVFLKTTLTDVRIEDLLPQQFALGQNYPNPFNPATKIQYRLPFGSDVKLSVYNLLGQEVATLVNGYRTAGSYEADFTATKLASGVYYYTLKAGRFTETKKMILTK